MRIGITCYPTYGGSGVGNFGVVHVGEDKRATMVLPPLGVLWLRHDRSAALADPLV